MALGVLLCVAGATDAGVCCRSTGVRTTGADFGTVAMTVMIVFVFMLAAVLLLLLVPTTTVT